MNRTLILSLDWIGSVLMLGTIWGWIYAKLSPAIKRRLARSERHLKAFDRLLRIRFGAAAFEDQDNPEVKDPLLKRYRAYRKRIGIHSKMSIASRAFLGAEIFEYSGLQ